MSKPTMHIRALLVGVSLLVGASTMTAAAASKAQRINAKAPVAPAALNSKDLDRSGAKRFGKASFYADKYHGRTMSDGTKFSQYSDSAASLTLPLGTTVLVTNLETGRSAVVMIRDRGPYVKGRIIDLSTATAQKIGIERKQGVAPVEVAPIAVKLADGRFKPGVAARDDNDMVAYSQMNM